MSTKSVEEITNFILKQFDKKLRALEDKCMAQKSSLKGLKKSKKLAEMVSKPFEKPAVPQESSLNMSVSGDFKLFMRSRFPEASSLCIHEMGGMVRVTPKYRKFEDSFLPLQGDTSQLASKSILEMLGEPKSAKTEQSRMIRARTKSTTSLLASSKKTTNDLGFEIETDLNRTGPIEEKTVNESAKQSNAHHQELRSQWENYKKGILMTKQVLREYRGSRAELRPKSRERR